MNRTGRFAPSPTGSLHLGNLRTGLLAWLYARSQGGRFLMRIEDLDRGRVRREHEAGQLADLRAIGVDWDGDPVRQSERAELYATAVDRLDTYPCWCSRAEIRAAASAPQAGSPDSAYPGTCRELTAAQRSDRERSGRPPALRVRTEADEIRFVDRIHGAVSGIPDDFVVRRNDGVYAYNLAVVVDDGEQGIGEAVRADDLLDSTLRQVWLTERLGLQLFSYVHVPLLLGGDGERLAKRHGAVTLADRAGRGETPDDVRALLATSVGLCDPLERPSPEDLLLRFEPERFAPPAAGPLPSK